MILPKNKNIAFALLFLIIFLIYNNTFHCSWQFDDASNILENTKLHLTNLSWESIKGSFHAATNGNNSLYRPVSCLTLALNWYLGQDNVTGYHIVNIIIHVLASWMLFLTVFRIFQTPNIRKRQYTENDIFFIALLTACLWAINPIQTQAVTYIVQRMTSLSALFYISALYFYISGRICYPRLRQQVYFFFMCVTSFILAMGSKEHTITLPLVLFLSEIAFFQNLGDPEIRKFLFRLSIVAGITAILAGLLLFYITIKGYGFENFLNIYKLRPFTLSERFLTQFRVIIFYLGLIIYPVAPRLSLMHDMEISTSLIHPWTTLPAIFFVFFLIALGIWLLRHHPVSGFSILFFFVTHTVESTILPLEMIFEHRNYLPSMFLFLPVAQGIKWILDYYRLKKKMYVLLTVFITFLIAGLGMGTYIRNIVWHSEKSIWTDVAEKYPELGRPWYYIANYYKEAGDQDEALKLFHKAISLKFQLPEYRRMICLNNIGTIHSDRHEYDKAIYFYEKALSVFPSYPDAIYNLALTKASVGERDVALQKLDELLTLYKNNRDEYLVMKGNILMDMNKVGDALSLFQEAFRINPNSHKIIGHMGIALSLNNKYATAEHFLIQSYQAEPDIYPALWLIENSRRAGNREKKQKYIDILLDTYPFSEIKKSFASIISNNLLITPPPDSLIPAIRQRAEERLATWSAEFSSPAGTD